MKGEDVQVILLEPLDVTGARAHEHALVEREVARLTGDGRRLASRIIARIVEIEAEWGPDVAEAVVDRVIDSLRGRRRVLS